MHHCDRYCAHYFVKPTNFEIEMSENLQKIEASHTSKNILVLQDLTKTFNKAQTVAVFELSLNIKKE